MYSTDHVLQMSASVQASSQNGAKSGGPEGIPRLPPIQRPSTREDPFANSKLLKFRISRHKQEHLKKIM